MAIPLRCWRGGLMTQSGHLGGRVAVRGSTKQQQKQRKCFPLALYAQMRDAVAAEIVTPKFKPGDRAKGQVDTRLLDYVQAQTREPELRILRELRMEAVQSGNSHMQVSPDQGQLLAMLARLMGAKQCIEVGVFNGYSALAVALVLPDSGKLVACDRSETSLAIARKYFERAGVSYKVDIRIGLAIDSLKQLLLEGGVGRYDFAFIDADKDMYLQYYELLLQLMRSGGLVVVDNVLWRGQVADPSVTDKKTQSIRNFNTFLLQDSRIDYNLIAIGDGMALCRKL